MPMHRSKPQTDLCSMLQQAERAEAQAQTQTRTQTQIHPNEAASSQTSAAHVHVRADDIERSMETRKTVRFADADVEPRITHLQPEPDDEPIGLVEMPVVDSEEEDGVYIETLEFDALTLGRQIPRHPGRAIATDTPAMVRKAASFCIRSHSHAQTRAVPCSPPVPIPTRDMRRSSASQLLPVHRSQFHYRPVHTCCMCSPEKMSISRTQCEARLWDEDWHFKLSLESRESFEAKEKPRTDSAASSVETTQDDECDSDGGGDVEELSVFDMDDL